MKTRKKLSAVEWAMERWKPIGWALGVIIALITFSAVWAGSDLPVPATRGWTHETYGKSVKEVQVVLAEDRISRFKEKIRDLDRDLKKTTGKAERAVLEKRVDELKDQLKKATNWHEYLTRK